MTELNQIYEKACKFIDPHSTHFLSLINNKPFSSIDSNLAKDLSEAKIKSKELLKLALEPKTDPSTHMAFLQEKYSIQIDSTHINDLLNLAHLCYLNAEFKTCLSICSSLLSISTDNSIILQATYGCCISSLLSGDKETSLKTLSTLKDLVDTTSTHPHISLLSYRSQLVHLSLFLFKETHEHVSMFTHPIHIAPYLLRYISISLLLKKKYSKEILRMIQTETYRDPIINLLISLFTEFDFKRISTLFPIAIESIESDYLLISIKHEIVNTLRDLIMTAFIKIHHSIKVCDAVKLLSLNENELKAWMNEFCEKQSIGIEWSEARILFIGKQDVFDFVSELKDRSQSICKRVNEIEIK